MQLKKLIAAGALGLLMAGSSIAFAANLADYPSPFVAKTDGGAQTFVVVGDSAKPSDVIGAVDIATRLGGEVTKTTTVQCGGKTTVSVTGRTREITIDDETVEGKFGSALKPSAIPYLLEKTITWKGGTYSVYEEIDLSNIGKIAEDITDQMVNGTAYVKIDKGDGTTSSDICYKYVFKTSGIAPNTTYPLEVTLLGDKTLTLTGYSGGVQILAGFIDTFDLNTLSKTVGPYKVTVYGWDTSARNKTSYTIEKDGASVQTDELGIGDSGTYTLGSETVKIKVLDQKKGIKTDGTEYWQQKIVVGNETEVQLTSDPYKYYSGDSTSGYVITTNIDGSTIDAGDYIAVCPKLQNDTYIKYGQTFNFANGYFQIGFPSWQTSSFKTFTIEADGSKSLYNESNLTQLLMSDIPAIKVSSEGQNLQLGANYYSDLWVLYNKTIDGAQAAAVVWIAEKDTTTGKLKNIGYDRVINGTAVNLFNITNDLTSGTSAYQFKLTKVNQSGNIENRTLVEIENPRDKISFNVEYNFTRKIVDFVNSTGISINGTNVNEERYDKADNGYGNGPISDYGLIIDKPFANFASDKVVLKVPSEQVKAVIAIGKDISVGAGAGTATSTTAVPIKTPLGKLASEIDSTIKSTKNLILVGGPCANSLVKDLLNTAWNVPDSCAAWLDSTGAHYIPAGQAMIKLIDNAFGTGKAALIVAGTNAADTRAAAAVLQAYDDYAASLKGTEVKVVGTTVTQVA